MEYTPRNETKIVLIDGKQLAQLIIDYILVARLSTLTNLKKFTATILEKSKTYGQTEGRKANSRFAKWRVMLLIEALCFCQSSAYVDSLMHLNRHTSTNKTLAANVSEKRHQSM